MRSNSLAMAHSSLMEMGLSVVISLRLHGSVGNVGVARLPGTGRRPNPPAS